MDQSLSAKEFCHLKLATCVRGPSMLRIESTYPLLLICRLLASTRKGSSLRDYRPAMAVAVGAPPTFPSAAADSMVAGPLPWHARALEGTLESSTSTSGHADTFTEEEYRGHLFDDAEAQKQLDIVRALSQVSLPHCAGSSPSMHSLLCRACSRAHPLRAFSAPCGCTRFWRGHHP